MSLFACHCTIDENRLDLFARLRADHYAFLIAEQGRIRFGGPACTAEGGPPETMIIVVEAEDLETAQRWIAREPYNAHGGFKAVAVRPWTQVLPETEPGTLARTHAEEVAKASDGGRRSA